MEPRVGQYLTVDQLVVKQVYKIETPYLSFPSDVDEADEDPGEPELRVRKRMGSLVSKAGPDLVFTMIPGNTRLVVGRPISVAPISRNDLRPRISATGRSVTTAKALAGLGPDVSKKVLGYMGGRKKTRRKSKKTLRKSKW